MRAGEGEEGVSGEGEGKEWRHSKGLGDDG